MEPWIEFVSIGLIALAAGFVHSAIGFGFGIVAISLIPIVMDVRTAHVVVSISSVPMLMMAAWTYRRGVEKRSLVEALVGAAIFLPLGFYLFKTSSMSWLVRGTGFAIFLMVVWSLRDRSRNANSSRSELPRGTCFLAGGAGGFLAGAVSIAGPPIAAFALKQNWSQSQYKSFVAQCLIVIALYKSVFLAEGGFLVQDVFGRAAVAATLSVLGVSIGARATARIPAARFKWLVAIALLVVSLWMMWSG
ncbi:MAG: sulfite exporter TauE/SafE family protein [Planctomycetota bacterium]